MKEFFSILKRTDSSAFRARVRLFFFLTKIGVSRCGIKVYICSERLEYGYDVCPQRKHYTPYGKIFFQIL